MDAVLIVLTILFAAAALLLGGVVWRQTHAERARSTARVAALAAAAADGVSDEAIVPVPAGAHTAPGEPMHSPVTTPRSDAAPDALHAYSEERAPASRAGDPELWLRKATATPSHSARVDANTPAPLHDAFLGRSVEPSGGSRQRGLAIAAIALFVVVVTGGYWSLYGGGASAANDAAVVAPAAPLELISMRHERQGTRLSVTGLIRNPVGGTTIQKLAAVVFLFDQQGAFVTSARADVDFTSLPPGDESPFVVSLDAPGKVARYRVSFRTDAGVVPHVDRRGDAPLARELP